MVVWWRLSHNTRPWITDAFKAALAGNNLRTYYGDDASVQPGNLREGLLHETAVAWVRRREEATRPREAWKETVAEFGARLRKICQDINDSCDVEGLCRGLPRRVEALVEAHGDRISA